MLMNPASRRRFRRTKVAAPADVPLSPEPPKPNGSTLAALQALVDDMAPGDWRAVPNSNPGVTGQGVFPADRVAADTIAYGEYPPPTDPVRRTQYPSIWGNNQTFCISPWCGSAYDSDGHKWYFCGGGHNDYGGNEVYEFDLDTLKWTRLTDPAPLTLWDETIDNYIPDYNKNHGPISAHTYNGQIWNPVSRHFWLFGIGVSFSETSKTPSTPKLWRFDPSAITSPPGAKGAGWEAFDPPYLMRFGSVAMLPGDHPHHPNKMLAIYGMVPEPGTGYRHAAVVDSEGTFTDLGRIAGWNSDSYETFTFGTPDGRIFVLGDYRIQEIMVEANVAKVVATQRHPTDFSGIVPEWFRVGVDYHPGTGKFVLWDGRKHVITFDPSAMSYQIVYNDTSNNDPGPWTSVFRKWFYVSQIDAFLGIKSENDSVWIWKPSTSAVSLQPELGDLVVDGITRTSVAYNVPFVNNNTDRNYSATAAAQYKRSSDPDQPQYWTDAPDPFRTRPEATILADGYEWDENEQDSGKLPSGFAGAVWDLQPGTRYDIRITVADPADGVAGSATKTITCTTRAVPPEPGTTTKTVANAAEWIDALDSAVPGDVIEVTAVDIDLSDAALSAIGKNRLDLDWHARQTGTAQNPIYVKGTDRTKGFYGGSGVPQDRPVRLFASHIIFQDLTITGFKESAIHHGNGGILEEICVRRCVISAADVDVEDPSPKYYPNGLKFWGGTNGLYVYDNEFIGPLSYPTITTTAKGIIAIYLGGQRGCEVAHNTFRGWGDGIEANPAVAPQSPRGNRYHHNVIEFGSDDGLEGDYSIYGTVIDHNLIANTGGGVSFQPSLGGPNYICFNVMINTKDGPFKIKPPESDPPVGVFIYNNTSVKNPLAWEQYSMDGAFLTVMNNLYVFDDAVDPSTYSFVVAGNGYQTIVDYNAYAGPDGGFRWSPEPAVDVRSFAEWQAAGKDRHGYRFDVPKGSAPDGTLFATYDVLGVASDARLDTDAWGDFQRATSGVGFALGTRCPAYGTGCVIPGVTPRSNVHIGAWQEGKPPSYGKTW